MEFDPTDISAFLGAEGKIDPKFPKRLEFCLPKSSGEVRLTIDAEHSIVEIETVDANSSIIFDAMFKCDGILVDRGTKMKPHLFMELASSEQNSSMILLYGPPDYICSLNHLLRPDEPPPAHSVGEIVKKVYGKEVYQVDLIRTAPGPKPRWATFKDGKHDGYPKGASGVLEHFDKQAEGKKTQGIFIHSETHSIQFTEEQKEEMKPSYLRDLHQNPEWRNSENALIDELVGECVPRGIQVWVNIQRNDDPYWKCLTQPPNENEQTGDK
ncbi:hypothetical protein N9B94_01435 [Verrucomicrobia bacterium]|nr:hypothetical protein [Verrucomicrobiota bacterium]MDB4459155.1 hypothetical protein [bacterium]